MDARTGLVIELPMVDGMPPLTANQRFHWAEKARRTRLVRQAAGWRAATFRCGPQKHITVQLHFQPQDRRRRDPSNLMPTQKAAVDGLLDAALVPDDTPRWVRELMPVIHEPDGGERRLWLSVEVQS